MAIPIKWRKKLFSSAGVSSAKKRLLGKHRGMRYIG